MLFVVSEEYAESVTNIQYHVSAAGLTTVNVALPDVKDDRVWTRELPVLQVEVVDEYSFAV